MKCLTINVLASDCAVSPCFNLTGCVHPQQLTTWLDGERSTTTNNDGLYARFLVACARPVFPDADDVPDERADVPSLSRFFYALGLLHEQPCIYRYTDEAADVIKSEYNKYQEYLRDNHSLDSYLSGKLCLLVYIRVHLQVLPVMH